jgi:hypothetical protein
MWKLSKLWIFLPVICCLACNNSAPENNKPSIDSPVYFPYAPVKSNSFDKGKDTLARNVLQIWRQYETGNIKSTDKFFADTVRLILSDQIIEGSRDTVMKQYQKRRDAYAEMQSFVYSWLPVHTADTKQDFVYVWGLHDGTKKNGDRDYALLHEIWRFDRNGKIREMEQFRTHPH